MSKELIEKEPVKCDFREEYPVLEDSTGESFCSFSRIILSNPLINKKSATCDLREEYPDLEDWTDETVCSLWDSSSTIDRRKVVFQTNEQGNIMVKEHAATEELTAEECAAAWYRASELKYFRKYGKKLATIAAASKYGKDFLKTCKACERGEKDLDKYSKIANSGARGLEVLVVPQLVKDRKATIRSVLKAQSKFTEKMALDQKADILCATSRILSRETTLLARLLAKGDANVAKAVHEEETTSAVGDENVVKAVSEEVTTSDE